MRVGQKSIAAAMIGILFCVGLAGCGDNADDATTDLADTGIAKEQAADSTDQDEAQLESDKAAAEAKAKEEAERKAAEEKAAEEAAAKAEAERQAAEAAAAQEEADRRAREAEAAALAEKNERTVYITDTGKKYHDSDCRHLKKSKKGIGLSDAKEQGYEPCGTCNP